MLRVTGQSEYMKEEKSETSEGVCVEVSVSSVCDRHICIYSGVWESSSVNRGQRKSRAPQR